MTKKLKTGGVVAPHLPPEAFSVLERNLARAYNSRFILDPSEMVESVKAYQLLEELALSETPACANDLIDWEHVYKKDYQAGIYSYLADALAIDQLNAIERQAWLDFVEREYALATNGNENSDKWNSISNVEVAKILDFLVNPSQSTVSISPWLKEIPDIATKAELLNASRRRVRAKHMVQFAPKPLCLSRYHIDYPDSLGDAIKGDLQCWMFLAHDVNGDISLDELKDMSILQLSAVFVDNQGNGKALPVAVVVGLYVVPFKDDYRVSQESLMYNMDGHSAYLNDTWKVLIGKFLPEHDWFSLNDFHEYYGMLAGIADVSIEVCPAYRGHKLSGLLLSTITRMTEKDYLYDYLSLFNAIMYDGKQDTDEDFWYVDVDSNSLSFAPIRLFTIGIEGTMPVQDNGYDDIARIFIPKPKPKGKVINMDVNIERKRLKLTKYFNDVGSESGGYYYVQTFNPWDYPEA